MTKGKVCLVGQFPPPMHGLSKALETLYESPLQQTFSFEKVDITSNKNFFKNRRKIKRTDAEVIYLTVAQSRFGNLRDLLLIRGITKKGRKLIIHIHGGYFRTMYERLPKWQKKLNQKWLFSKLSAGIVLGPSLRPLLEGVVETEKIKTVFNCVDDEFLLDKEHLEEKLSKVKEKSVLHVLYLSNFIKEKGYPYVLELAKLERQSIRDGNPQRFFFDFAGAFFNDQDKAQFFDEISKNDLGIVCKYHGPVYGDAKISLLASSDIFVLPTRYPMEGQPISILEAMGNGLFVMTTDHAGIPDLINEHNGLIVDANPQQTYEAMKGVDFSVCRKNYDLVLREFQEKSYLNNLAQVFNEVLAK